MKQKKLLTLFLTVATSFSMLVACSNATFAESTGTATVTESTNTTDKKQKADENQDAAKQLLVDLTGSYQELWPVILDEKYQQIWIDDCTELVGEENAEAAYDKLASMVSGTIYGEEAVEAFEYLSRTEGIIPAIESAHAVAYAKKIVPQMRKDQIVVITISGRGDKDCAAIARYRGEDIHE